MVSKAKVLQGKYKAKLGLLNQKNLKSERGIVEIFLVVLCDK